MSGRGGSPAEGPSITVVGLDESARLLVEFVLGHGEDPELGLRRRGFDNVATQRVTGTSDPHALRFEYLVRVARPRGGSPARARREAGEGAAPHQRVAAYAVLRSDRGVLLTQYSARTRRKGLWGLPGGGLDPGELPEQALHRELWEETGQLAEDLRLHSIGAQHWVGLAPSGRLEDFHAVSVVYAGVCPEPSDPVVHDPDGTTAAAAWVAPGRLPPLAPEASWAGGLLAPVTGAGG